MPRHSLTDDLKYYLYIDRHIVPYVDMEALQEYGIPIAYTQNHGPFHRVAEVHWENMRTSLGITKTTTSLKRWANNNYLKGNPLFRQIKFGEFDFERGVAFLREVGREQQEQRVRIGMNPLRREEPLPNNPSSTPDVYIPAGLMEDINLYTVENGDSEDEKLAREVLRSVIHWKRKRGNTGSTTADAVTAQQRADLILSEIRKHTGLVLENDPFWNHFLNELHRVNSGSDNVDRTFARGAYNAVWKYKAGK